ncbi:Muscle M-line assembly protein unc-89 [Talaromyces islandicus]|uniref:Muscle M-line assembly protein unc-89 n=1 Tax=Talaromyces islandicus TaxID=28573 RepID=A0A0U1M6W5_TALIS|nr:Muscle M-line assembly protein unc-89 [Talaromyces islandicus]
MSAPSTPRSTRNASPDHEASPAAVLTPGQKIKAMLAQFDSDSDSDDAGSSTTQPKQRLSSSKPHLSSNTEQSATQDTQDDPEDDDDDEDNVIFAPRGRMAARMQGHQDDNADLKPASPQNADSAYERVARTLRAPSHDRQSENTKQPAEIDQSSDDDISSAPFRRRLSNKNPTKSHSPEKGDGTRRPGFPRLESPLFLDDESDPETRTEPEPRPRSSKEGEPENARLLALVAQKRKEREEQERVEAEKKAARAERAKQFSSDILSGEDSADDPESARKMTQQSRPARKASKKAIEEMNKETQRMSRNMQLTHQARTKRKLTKESFLARFALGKQQDAPTQNGSDPPTSSSSAPSSDGEANKEKTTPPTSPIPLPFNDETKDNATLENVVDKDFRFPTLEELKSEVENNPQTVTVEQVQISEVPTERDAVSTAKKVAPHTELAKPAVRVRVSREKVARYQQDASDDDDLDVITSPGRCRKLAAFENLPVRNAQEDKSMLKLKLLAHLTSPTRRSKSMTPAELGASLRLKARQQALQERQARIEELRARGIVIETAEEREAMEVDIEDLVEKARKEAFDIARREKAARGENPDGENDDEDEEDYDFSGSDEDKMEDIEEDGEEGDDEEEDEEEEDVENDDDPENEDSTLKQSTNLLEDEANETSESEDEQSEVVSLDGDNEIPAQGRGRRQRRIVSDDEDEETEKPQEVKTPARSIAPSVGSAQRPHFPDMPETSSFGMSMTQAFAGTLAEDQSDEGEDSFRIIKSLPDPGLVESRSFGMPSQVMVRDSQEERRQSIDLLAGYTQSDSRVSESPAPSQFPEPTQDAGFVLSPFDHTKRFADPPTSTIDTVLISQSESPIAQRRRLQRRRPADLSDEEDNNFEIKASAFDVMKKASKRKPSVPFDKMKSNARNHVDEAAEESEDEYAGLGGASDDDDGGENEYDREMINDSSAEVVDEKELAALNANHQRAMDEKQVSKLLKDITTGALRRRRGGDDDLDLDDSDDERMARRRAKQREFAKMRQALLADEKVNEIANDPKKVAFFKALEDRDDDDDMDLEFDYGTNSQGESSQVFQAEGEATEPAATHHNRQSTKRKRPLEPSTDDTTNRPPPNLRRTAVSVSRKPSSLTEIRETLSFLTETPEYDSFREDASVEEDIVYNTDKESEDESSAQENKTSTDGFAIPPNPRRTRGRVVDRLALLRAASSNSASSGTKSAFASNSSSDGLPKVGFRPPPLLRRSTTASSSTSISSSSSSSSGRMTTTANSATSGTKKGAVNYYAAARERERERELRVRERSSASSTASIFKQRALASSLGSLTRNQWE